MCVCPSPSTLQWRQNVLSTTTDTECALRLALGAALAKDSRPMVYGGGSIGLMGAVAESVLENGGYVTGISPYAMTISGGECLKEDERGHTQQPYARLWVDSHPNRENVIVDDMHTRKQMMALNATGGFVCLPGGYGTLEEVRGGSAFAMEMEFHALVNHRYWKQQLGFSSRFRSSVCPPFVSSVCSPIQLTHQRLSSSTSSTIMHHCVPS